MSRKEVWRVDGSSGGEPFVGLSAEESKEATYIHPEADVLFNKAPCLRKVPMLGEAVEGYGPKAVLSIGLSYFLCKGVANSLVGGSMVAMFLNRFGVEGTVYQRLSNIGTMGWSVKPIIAATSDIFPFFGYTKRWYMFTANILGPIFSLAFALLPAQASSGSTAAICLFFSGLSMSCTDILSEGHYSRMMRNVPGPGPALVSWIWWLITVASLISSFVVGPLGDAEIPQVCPMIACAVQLFLVPIFLFNLFGERPNREERIIDSRIIHEQNLKESGVSSSTAKTIVSVGADGSGIGIPSAAIEPTFHLGAHDNKEAAEPFVFKEARVCCCGAFEMNEEVLRRNKRETLYGALMALFVVAVACASLLGSPLHLLIATLVVSLGHCSFNFYALSWAVAKVNLFVYLSNASTVTFGGATTPFFLSGPDCNPDGPHFSLFFAQTVGGTLSSINSALGIILFNYFLSKKTYRMTYFLTLMLLIVSNIFDSIIVMRWNRPYVSDYVVYIFGDLIISPVIVMINWMPLVILLSRLCPRGSESTVYAILAASSNLGSTVGTALGSVIMEYALPVKTIVPCNFNNVKWLVLISCFLAPCIQIPLIFTLLPDARMNEDLDAKGKPVRKVVEFWDHAEGSGDTCGKDSEPGGAAGAERVQRIP